MYTFQIMAIINTSFINTVPVTVILLILAQFYSAEPNACPSECRCMFDNSNRLQTICIEGMLIICYAFSRIITYIPCMEIIEIIRNNRQPDRNTNQENWSPDQSINNTRSTTYRYRANIQWARTNGGAEDNRV